MTRKLPWSMVIAVGLVGLLSALQGAGAQPPPGSEGGAEKKAGSGEAPRQEREDQALRRGHHARRPRATPACSSSIGSTTRSFTRSRPRPWARRCSGSRQLEQDRNRGTATPATRSAIAWCGGSSRRRQSCSATSSTPSAPTPRTRSRTPSRPARWSRSSSVLPVKAYGKDKAPVIDVTSLFTARPARVRAPRGRQRQRRRPQAHVHREGQVVPREHRDQGPGDLPQGRRPRRRPGTPMPRRRGGGAR